MKKQLLLLAVLCLVAAQARGQISQPPMQAGNDAAQLMPATTDALTSIKQDKSVTLPLTVNLTSQAGDSLMLRFLDESVTMTNGRFAPGEYYQLAVTFTNHGEDFQGELYFVLVNPNNGEVLHLSEPTYVVISQGEEVRTFFSGICESYLTPGEYLGAFLSMDKGTTIFSDAGEYLFECIVEYPIIASGICGAEGNNLTWKFTEDGTLTISGEGEMLSAYFFDPDYYIPDKTEIPWYNNYYFDIEDIETVVIEDGVTSIGDYAFFNCSNLTRISIAESVTRIGESAFRNCENYFVDIPESVTSIGRDAFVKTYVYNNDWFWVDGVLYIDNCLIEAPPASISAEYTIQPGTRVIADEAFWECTYLRQVTIPESVTNIGRYAFYWCTDLTSVTIPESVTSIEYGTFYECTNLTSVTIPQSVTSIGDNAFFNCENLESVTIPNSVTSIGSGAFIGCRSLTSVNIPQGLTSIESVTFSDCTKLASITIPNNVTSIGTDAFMHCTSLTSLTIHEDMVSIGERAFSKCTGLAHIICYAPIPPSIGSDTFEGINRNSPVYVREESLLYYVAHPYWGTLFIQPLPNYSGIAAPSLAESITVKDGEVHINIIGVDEVQVYDLQGRHVLSTTESHFALPQDIYIIKVGREAVKVTL